MTQYRVTCLSPVLAGDGTALSPIDYMVWKDQVNVLNQQRIFRLLSKGPRLEGYLSQVQRATKLDFASWGGFAQNFAARRVPFEHPSAVSYWERLHSEDCFIPSFARNLDGAYVPGSVIRGALRTVVVAAAAQARPAALERSTEAARRPGSAVEREVMGSSDLLKAVAVGDSSAVDGDPFRICLVRTASLVEQKNAPGRFSLGWRLMPRGTVEPRRVGDSAALFVEMAMPGAVFRGSWTERAHYQSPEVIRALGWKHGYERAGLLKAANAYAAITLEQHRAFASVAGLTDLQASIEGLLGELHTATESGEWCLLNLGWGGGMLGKTLWPRLADENIRRVLSEHPFYARSVRSGMPFPKSRRIVFASDRPAYLAGWVRLELD